MWPFTKKQKPGILKLIIDIRSSSIGGALVVHEENKEPLIIYSTRNYIFLDKLENLDTFFTKILSGLDKVLENIEKEGIKRNAVKFSDNHVSEVWCAFSSPWYKSKIKNFEINDGKPVKFTSKLLNHVLEQEAESNKKDIDEVSIEKKIISVFMNDYEIANPFEKIADKIMVSFYSSNIATKTELAVKDRISSKFNTNNIKFCSHPLVIISVIKKLFHSVSDFLFIDVGGETTDIGLLRAGKLEDLITIPVGTHHFLRKLISEYSFDLAAASSHLNLLFNHKLDDIASTRSMAVINKVKSEWFSIIKNALENKWVKEVTPSLIFLTADTDVNNLLKDIILSKEFYVDCLKINKEPVLQILNRNSIPNLCNQDTDVRQDPVLSLVSTFSDFDNI